MVAPLWSVTVATNATCSPTVIVDGPVTVTCVGTGTGTGTGISGSGSSGNPSTSGSAGTGGNGASSGNGGGDGSSGGDNSHASGCGYTTVGAPTAPIGTLPTTTSWPASRASFSVSPNDATCG